MHTPLWFIMWQLMFPSRYFCHVYRPSIVIVQIRSGADYGKGKVLAEGAEDPTAPGATIPELVETAWVRLHGRTLCPTVHGRVAIGQPLLSMNEPFGRHDPQIGQTWANEGRRFRDRSTEVPASTVIILERLRHANGPMVRVQDVQTKLVEEHPLAPFRKHYRLVPEPPAPDL